MQCRADAIECPPGPCQREVEESRGPWRERGTGFLAGLLCAAVVGAAAAALPVERLAQAAAASVAEAPAPTRGELPRELPREWRWERKALTFDSMFRER